MSNGAKIFWIILGVVLLLIIGIVLLNRGGGQSSSNQNHPLVLTDYATKSTSSVVYSIDGPINAAEDHRSAEIDISAQTRSVTVYDGYQHSVEATKTYPNNQPAYAQFLAALKRGGFTVVRSAGKNVDYTAICPLGNRSFYQLQNAGQTLQNLWTASCSAGSFGGSTSLVNALFEEQIPDFNSLTGQIDWGSNGSSAIL